MSLPDGKSHGFRGDQPQVNPLRGLQFREGVVFRCNLGADRIFCMAGLLHLVHVILSWSLEEKTILSKAAPHSLHWNS